VSCAWPLRGRDTADALAHRYVHVGATSTIKGKSDQRNYEKVGAALMLRHALRGFLNARRGASQARELKKHIDAIRADYKKNMKSTDVAQARWCGASSREPGAHTAARACGLTGAAGCHNLPGGQAGTSRWRRERRRPGRHCRGLHAAGARSTLERCCSWLHLVALTPRTSPGWPRQAHAALHADVRLPGARGLRCMACAGRLPDVVLRRARTPSATCRSTTSCQKCTTPSASLPSVRCSHASAARRT
jgi:hypothetical protein